jgi:Ca2+/Na+ antiporter
MRLIYDPRVQAVALLAVGVAGLLTSVLTLARSMFSELEPAPGRRALAHWLPVAATVIVAAVLGQTGIAIGVIFGSSVAVLSSVTGFVAVMGAPGPAESPAIVKRVWTFLPVPVLLAFFVGFQGSLGWFEAAVLLAQGMLVLLVWRGEAGVPAAGAEPTGLTGETASRPGGGVVLRRIIEAILLIGLAALAAWSATRGAQKLQQSDHRYPAAALAPMLMSVVLAMPMISTGVPAAVDGKAWAALTGQVGVVLLNLCVLLPVAVMIPSGIDLARFLTGHGVEGPATMPASAPSTVPASSMPASMPASMPVWGGWEMVPYPRLAWRIDTVALMILSLMFAGAAAGKLRIDRRLGPALITAYFIYLVATLVLSRHGLG